MTRLCPVRLFLTGSLFTFCAPGRSPRCAPVVTRHEPCSKLMANASLTVLDYGNRSVPMRHGPLPPASEHGAGLFFVLCPVRHRTITMNASQHPTLSQEQRMRGCAPIFRTINPDGWVTALP